MVTSQKLTPEQIEWMAENAPRIFQQDPDFFFEKILGVKLWGMQREIVFGVRDWRETWVYSCHAAGKGLPLDTPVATPEGWTTMGELKAGDTVFNESGKPVRVNAVHPTRNIPCYRVTFDNGTSLVCDQDHLWTTLDWKTRHRLTIGARAKGGRITDWREHWAQGQTRSVAELQSELTHNGQRSQIVPIAGVLELPERNYELAPYAMGAWLGDGTSVRPEITDPAYELRPFFEQLGYATREATVTNRSRMFRFWPVGDGVPLLRRLGVYGNKHITDEYMRGSFEQRLELLRGLMDSDGYCESRKRGGVELCLTNQRLAEDAAALIASLGCKVHIRESDAKLYGRFISRRWRICFTSTFNPFKLKRKADDWTAPDIQSSRATAHVITGIEPIESVPTRCISVEGERELYLAGRQLIPTHNTYTASKIALWFLYAYPGSIVITTAPTYRQVKDLLWREIRSSYDAAWFKPVKKANTTDLNFATDWYAIGLSTNDPDKFQGYHAASGHLLVIADEAAGIEELIFEAVDAVLTTADTRLLGIGNPTSSSGRFFKSAREMGNKKIKIRAWDTPNFTHNNIKSWQDLCAIYDPPPDMTDEERERWKEPELPHPNPRLLSPAAAHKMVHKFGVESPWFQSRVEAVFPDQGSDTLIPLSWIERAMSKKRREGDWELTGPPIQKDGKWEEQKKWVPGIPRGDKRIGVDPARFGDDRTVILYREGHNVRDIRAYRKENTIETTNRVQYNLHKYDMKLGRIGIDGGGGYGGGIVDQLNQWLDHSDQINGGYRIPVSEVMVAKPPTHDPFGRFLNLRAQLYWELRTLFEEDKIAIPDGDIGEDLANELSQIKFVVMPGGKIKIEEKAELKKRLLRSPDLADALMISYATPTLSEFVDEDKQIKAQPTPEPDFYREREREAHTPVTAGLRDEQF